MNDRECLRTSTNLWRSLCDHCELMANCIRKPIRHTFATAETSITFETPQKRPRMLTNSYECLAIICDITNSWRTAFVSPFAKYSPQCETSIILFSHCGEYPCEWKQIIFAANSPEWRIYGEWAYECNSPPIRNDRKVIAIHS